MPTLLLNLVGPQSWSASSHFKHRDTATEPSKSGVYGLIEAAMGLQRNETFPQLDDLRFGARVDRPGHWEVDFQTAQSVAMANGRGHKNEVLRKSYLADAHFVVALEGKQTVLETIQKNLLNPKRPVHLGRRAFSPIAPIILPDALRPEELEPALTAYPWRANHLFSWAIRETDEVLRVVVDDETGYEVRHDVRMGPPALREFTRRRVRTDWVKPVWVPPKAKSTAPRLQGETTLVSPPGVIVPNAFEQTESPETTRPQSSPLLYESLVVFKNPRFNPDDMNIVHRIVLDALGLKGSPRRLPVLFRLDQHEKGTFKLAVRCPKQPDWSRITQFDLIENKSGIFQIPDLSGGDRFQFEILVNPTKKREGKKFGLYEPVQQFNWFQKKAEQRGGFEVVEITRQLQNHRLVKRGDRKIFFTGVKFEGIGSIVDQKLFVQSLRDGLAASGKFAGFNMLQLLEHPV